MARWGPIARLVPVEGQTGAGCGQGEHPCRASVAEAPNISFAGSAACSTRPPAGAWASAGAVIACLRAASCCRCGPVEACGRDGRPYRLRGYTPGGHLVAETAALCSHHRGLIWAAWQGQFRMPAITPA
jgi:hypothetical protein